MQQKLTIISFTEIIKIIQYENSDFSRKTKEDGTSQFFFSLAFNSFFQGPGALGGKPKKENVSFYIWNSPSQN